MDDRYVVKACAQLRDDALYVDIYRGLFLIVALLRALHALRQYGCVTLEMR